MSTQVNSTSVAAKQTESSVGESQVNQPATAPSLNDPATLRRQLRDLQRPLQELDHRQREECLRETASLLGRRDALELLEEIAAQWGLSWSTIGRMLGVSASAMRKWRSGRGAISSESREQIALLRAFLDMVGLCKEPIADIGSWVEMRVREDTTLTPADIYASGPRGRLLVVDLAGEIMSPAQTLDAFDEDWRTRYARDSAFHVVETGPGGERAIVPK
jgi:DNA-binding transcriptional regulator YiaG